VTTSEDHKRNNVHGEPVNELVVAAEMPAENSPFTAATKPARRSGGFLCFVL
jgi:hypothetical protein